MKHIYKITLVMILFLFVGQTAFSQLVSYQDNRGEQGITVQKQNMSGVKLNYSINQFTLKDQPVDGTPMKTVLLPDVFLPNDEGAPDLPGVSRYIIIPAGAEVNLKINSSRVESMKNVNVAPAPRIPLDTEDGPMLFAKDQSIYSTDAFYPAKPVVVSEPMQIRGVDVVMLGITPFQYNPVTKELLVYRDLEIEIVFEGGTKKVGCERLRSRWWDQIIEGNVLNSEILPAMDYNKQSMAPSDSPDYEYLIISPDDATFLTWADSIKKFRTLQGIYTGIVTTTEIGGNTVSAIENYVDNAYNTWTVAPSAVLLLGDYGTSGATITSQWFVHPASYPDFVSDNRFADVDGDDLPDIAFARITANTEAQLEVMITKFLDYERNPPTNADFYDRPITALGWQTERWFQICSEVVGGYLKNVKGKNPVRINAIYTGNPTSDPWSTATNTSTVLNYFGPNGLGYIPSTPQELGGFSGGTATDVANAINNGSYMLQHRDHGYYGGWGEPAFSTTTINSLTNVNNELPFIFSINCQTGAFHRSTESFAEKFHRYTYNGQNSGALGIIAATEVSYSFVNDTYVWGVFDNMHPDFMPDKTSTFPVNYAMPAFGNAAGKHFLAQTSWPYNSGDKQITYRLFHHHGDAFLTMYTEVPQHLAISHDPALQAGATQFGVTADAGSLIALTVNENIIATANGTGSETMIDLPVQNPGDVMVVTITKQNYFRYSSNVDIVSSGVFAQFQVDNQNPCAGTPVTFTDLSFGDITSWIWSFPGGTPSSFNGQNPDPISYNIAGVYDVSLTVSDGTNEHTTTKTAYIDVVDLTADFTASETTVIAGRTTTFSDLSSCQADSYSWSFPGGTPSSYTGKTPPEILYDTQGFFDVSLTVSNAAGSDTKTYTNYIEVVDCYAVSLPWTEDFESVGPVLTYSADATGINGSCRWSYEQTVNGRLQFSAYSYSGSKAAAMDASTSPDYSVNYLVGTLNLSDYVLSTDLQLSFMHMQYGEESHANDRVWIRGSVADTWVEVYDLYANQATSGAWVEASGIDIDAALAGAGQNISSTFQLRFGQEDNYPFTSDGRIFDDITITGTSGMVAPDCANLVAPAALGTDILVSSNLEWNSVANADGYRLYFGTDNPPSNIENGIDLGNTTLYNPSGDLAWSTTYYWQVIAYNISGNATGCATWSFTTEDEPIPPPACATLVSPADAASGVSVTAPLNWNSVADATGYKLSLGVENPPTTILNEVDLGNVTTYDPTGDLNYGTTYFWKVFAYNAGGNATGCAVWSFSTEVLPPVADFTANTTTIYEGETVNFTDLSSNNPTSWSWSFPEGNTANTTVQNPVVTYPVAGIYSVTLTAANAGGSDTETKTDYISVNVRPPVADFTASSTYVMIGESVDFTDLSSENPTSWSWTFSGGDPTTSTLQNPIVTYTAPGFYTVTLVATNAGGSGTETKTGYIEVWDGSINYCLAGGLDWSTEWIGGVNFGSFSNSSGAAGYSDFTSQIINVEGGLTYNVVLYPAFFDKSRREFWRVWIDYNNDGDFTDNGEEVVVADAKKNQVNATVTIPSGLNVQTRMRVAMKYQFAPTPCETFNYGEVEDYTINIGAPVPQPPVAAFSADQTSIAPGTSVQFTDESSNGPTSWYWSFPGGTPGNSTDQNPVVVYNGAGTFDATLTATNGEGSDVLTKSGYIVVSDNPANYCDSYGQSNAAEWIGGVTIGAFSNASGAAGYSDFTGSVISLSPGSVYSVTLLPGYSGKDEREFWRIWIDFNGDYDFEGADETVLVANNKKGAYSGNITIPSYAAGQTRMRVSMKGGASPSPCEIFAGGEVEDYTVDFGSKGLLGITDPGSLQTSVYPNPAGSTITISVATAQTTVKMYDIHGKLVKVFDMEDLEVEVDISDLNQGLYMIEFITSKGICYEKLIKH